MKSGIALAVLAFASTAGAQQASGNITGSAVAGDKVDIQGQATGFHRALKIDKDGKYQVRAVPVGDYLVTITHADGSEEQKAVTVRTGSTGRVQ